MTELFEFIGSYGFPIVMCLLLFNQNGKFTESINRYTETNQDLINVIKSLDAR